MSHNEKRKRLLSQREKALMEDKENHSEGRIKEKILLFRKLRNKYRDIAKRQKIAGKGLLAASPAGGSENNTSKKAAYFEEALRHFQGRLRDLYGGGPEERDVPKVGASHNPGITAEAFAERTAHGNDHELAQEKVERERRERSA